MHMAIRVSFSFSTSRSCKRTLNIDLPVHAECIGCGHSLKKSTTIYTASLMLAVKY